MWAFLLVIFILFFATSPPSQKVAALRLLRTNVPGHVTAGATVRLRCDFDMEDDELYSVKWYKSGHEFYRYLPKEKPNTQVYDVAGVKVEIKSSNDKEVTLRDVGRDTSGIYRCEVSAEAPSFVTVSEDGEMHVVVIPEKFEINGLKVNYDIGDLLRVNCTCRKSIPAAMLSWTINGNRATKDLVREFPTSIDVDGLETATLGLEFYVNPSDVTRLGDMQLKCTATIAPVYHNSDVRTLLVGNGPASVLESKETPIHVRADQQNGDCIRSATWWITATLSLLVKLLDG